MRIRTAAVTLLGLLLLEFASRPVQGQDVSGSLEGKLLTSQLQPLLDAEVVASGPALQQPMEVHSDAQGSFRFLALPAGTYTVRIRSIGVRPVLYERVIVGLGRSTSLGVVTMEPTDVELTEIVVTAEVLPLDLTSAASGTNLRAEQLDGLPLDRSLNSLISLAPEATYQLPDLSFRSEGVNIAGGSIWDNAYFVDGVNVTDPGMGAGGINLPYNFVQELQVKTGGYEAEYGRAMGGIVNVVTPSGGNDFHGSLFTYFTDDRLRTDPRYGLIQTNLDKYSQFDVGGSLGGPISRDRLWFFLAYNPLVDVRNASVPGIPTQKDRQTQHRLAGKLTWQPQPATRIAFTATGDPTTHDGVGPILDYGAPSVVLNTDVVLSHLRRGGYGLSLHAEQQMGESVLLSATLSRSVYRDDFAPQTTLGATAPRFTDTTGAWSGGYGGSGYNHLGRDAALTSVSVAAGSHLLKLGGEYENNTLDEVVDEGSGQRGGFLSQSRSSGRYVWLRAQSAANVGIRVLSGYLQDSWAPSASVRLNAGLRWEGQWWVGSGGTVMQSITDQLAPRVGLILMPGRPGSQKFFASAGRFYEQVPLDALALFYGTGSSTYIRYNQDPRIDTTGGTLLFTNQSGVYARVPGLRGEYYDELTFGYERQLAATMIVGARVILRAAKSVIEDSYASDGTPVYGNPGTGLLDSFPKPIHRYEALELTLQNSGSAKLHFLASYVLSRNWGNYAGLYAPEGSPPNASIQFDNHDSLAISSGPLPNDRTHAVKLSGAYRFGFGLTAGTSAFWQSGTPLNEYGIVQAGDYQAFLRPRGTAGRTPGTWDLNLRFDYAFRRGAGPKITLDVTHIGSPRGAVAFDQQHYTGTPDASGNQTDPNPIYQQVLVYQPAMFVRLGAMVGF